MNIVEKSIQDNLSLPNPIPIVTEIWVDDDYTPASCGGHTWGVDAFNRTQAAIYAADENFSTTINILPGVYYERLTIDRPVKLKGEIANGQFATNINGESGDKWAIICAPANDMGANNQFPDRDCFPAQSLQAYYTLKKLGYDDDNIILMLWHDDEITSSSYDCEPNDDNDTLDEYISIYDGTNNWLFGPDGQPGVAGVDDDGNGTIDDPASTPGEYPLEFGWPGSDDPIIDVDNKTVTKVTLQQQITNLSTQVTRDDHVLFYFTGHGRKNGTPEKCHLYFEDDSNGAAGHYLDADTLDSWLDQINCKRMTVLLDICRAQDFINSSPGLSAEPNRIIIGASGNITNIAHAWFNANPSHFAGSWFVHPFWERIGALDSIRQAYQYALKVSDQMAEGYPYPYQYPILIDKVRDANKYSLTPYGGNVVNFLNGAGDSSEIMDCNITGGENCSSIGINMQNHQVTPNQALADTNTTYFDVTDNCTAEDTSYFELFPTNQSELSDSFMICGANIFSQIYIKLSLGGAGSGGSFVIECATDRDTWKAASIRVDNTFGLTRTGDIIFKPPLEWAYQAHIHPVTNEKSEYGYWVRLRLIDNYDIIPQGDFIDLSYYSEGSPKVINNRIIGNEYGIYMKGINTQMTNRRPISGCEIINNEIDSEDGSSIYICYSNNITIKNNTCNSKKKNGIHLASSISAKIINNTCNMNNWSGIRLTESFFNFNINNTCLNNNRRGIYLVDSDSNTLINNTCNFNNWYGIKLYKSNLNALINNKCLNNVGGVGLNFSSNNIINNCSISSNSPNDFYFLENSKNNIALNTTFNTIYFSEPTSELIIKNYLHIQVNDSYGIPVQDADVKVIDNDKIIYATSGYSGSEPKTNGLGQIKWILATDRIYNGNAIATENITITTVKHDDKIFWDNHRNGDMSTSHFEYFYPNSLPSKINLENPSNNSYLNDSTPELKWIVGVDGNDDLLRYYIQIDEFGDDWTSLIASNFTDISKLTWNIIPPLADGAYQWRVCAYDGYENGSWSKAWKFTIDTIESISEITIPENNGNYNNLNTISGVASDLVNGTGVNKVEIIIMRLSDKKYWYGSKWSFLESWLLVSGTSEWSYDSSSIIWTSGTQYHVQSRSIDNANNVETPSAGNVFTIDMDRPLSTIDLPMNNTYLNNLDTISGSSKDLGGSGISKVEITIERTSDNSYWNGTGWNFTELWLPTTGTDVWSYSASSVAWETDTIYNIRSCTIDNAGNAEIPSLGNTFMYDDQPPELSISINNDDRYTNSISVILSLHSEDSGSGVDLMSFSLNGTVWFGWQSFETNRTFDLLAGDGEKIVYFKVKDKADNIAGPIVDSIILDTVPPEELSVVINENAKFTNSTLVTLALSAYDSLSGIGEMSFCTYIKIWTLWEPFNWTKHIYFTSGDGEEIVCFRVKDNAGNIALTNDTIILDTTPPHSLSIRINNGALETNSTLVMLKLNASDALSGVYQMSFSTNGNSWSHWENYTDIKSFTLPSGNGEKTLYFRVKDRAGNVAEPTSATILLNILDSDDDKDSQLNYIMAGTVITVIIIIIIVIIFGVYRYKKAKPLKKDIGEGLSQTAEKDIIDSTLEEE